ncbi:MAG: glycosyltransferase [Polyangia bacterium]
MKVGVLCTSCSEDAHDPAGHFVAAHARWLADHVGDVEVLVASAGSFDTGGLPAELRRRPWLAATLSAKLLIAARARRWDAVVSHWLVPSSAVAMTLGLPHVAIAHGSDIALLRALPGGEAFVRLLARHASLVYVADALRIDGAPGIVQPMPPMSTVRVDRAEARRVLGVKGMVALFLGRLIHDKGCDVLIDALPAGVTLLVAGDGPEREHLERRPTRGRVRFFGTQRAEDKARLLAAADLLVVPSRRDGAPTVVGEAHAAGLPVLATRVGGLPDLVGEGGWIVDPGELRRTLDRFHAEPGRLRSVPIPAPITWLTAGPAIWPFATHDITSRNLAITRL